MSWLPRIRRRAQQATGASDREQSFAAANLKKRQRMTIRRLKVDSALFAFDLVLLALGATGIIAMGPYSFFAMQCITGTMGVLTLISAIRALASNYEITFADPVVANSDVQAVVVNATAAEPRPGYCAALRSRLPNWSFSLCCARAKVDPVLELQAFRDNKNPSDADFARIINLIKDGKITREQLTNVSEWENNILGRAVYKCKPQSLKDLIAALDSRFGALFATELIKQPNKNGNNAVVHAINPEYFIGKRRKVTKDKTDRQECFEIILSRADLDAISDAGVLTIMKQYSDFSETIDSRKEFLNNLDTFVI